MASKIFQTHPPKSAEAELCFRKVSLIPAKLHAYAGHKSTPNGRSWIEAYCMKF